jgi:nicotinamide-nucleotide adenylyltransferase
MERIGLYIGKFQPFHNGHYKVVKHMLEMFDKLKIGIGDIKNNKLFAVEERIKMIKENFPEANIEFFLLEDLSSTHKYATQWGKYVEEVVGKFDFIAAVEDSYDDYIRNDFLKIGYPVIVFPRFGSISGTNVRQLITDNNSAWKDFLTNETQKIVAKSSFYKSVEN